MYRALHTPKYMIVFNLALTDLCGSTSLIPKLLDTLLFENRYISYELCLSYMFFVMFFSSLQSWTLATMACDRFVAICFPLHYHRVITKSSVFWLLLFVWLLCLCIMGTIVVLVDRLSFCQSVVVQSFFCDHETMYRIACNSASVNAQFVLFGGVVVIIIPLTVILCSYMSIAVVLKRASLADSLKALRTCSAHLILVAIFFIPLIGARTAATLPNSNPNIRMINFMLTYTIPSLLNPFVYSLKTEEMLTLIKNLYVKC
uniref:G-protein coupled receptors family 1 profile domain-containing protein n=1 Tax=Knipowitschia caucasica TaxID=637954 RepID=A0AAV2J6E7_KNICA